MNHKLKELIQLEVLKDLPLYIWLLPTGSESDARDLDSWKAAALYKARLDSRSSRSRGAKLKIGCWDQRDPFARERHRNSDSSFPRYAEDLWMPLPELVYYVRNRTFEWIHYFLLKDFVGFEVSYLRFIRNVWEHISGQVTNHSIPPYSQRNSVLQRFLRRLRSKDVFLSSPFLRQLEKRQPFILSTRRKRVALVRPKNEVVMHPRFGRQPISMKDIEHFLLMDNPFLKIIKESYEGLERELKLLYAATSEADEQALDLKFFNVIEKEKRLQGCGEYQNITIERSRSRTGPSLKLSHCLGHKPFLLQMCEKPIFSFWDLKKHPIRIVLEKTLRNPQEDVRMDALNSIVFQAESDHPSICRHPFVREAGMVNRYFRGNICMEETPYRILKLHHRQDNFDPVVCLLEQLRAAARILRYGLRSRDIGIPQHNPFAKIKNPEKQFQAIIKERHRAKDYARKHKAEIISFFR
jgi:hypothetical protein